MTNYYVGFYKNKNPYYIFARIIEWAQSTPYSHCEIIEVIDDDWASAVTFGSVFPKSRELPLSEMKKHYDLLYIIPLMNCSEYSPQILKALMNKNYSFGQILLVGINILTKGLLSCLPYVKLNLSKYLICTELVGVFMQESCNYRFDKSPEMLHGFDVEQIALAHILKDEV